jgi:hypothetical protein
VGSFKGDEDAWMEKYFDAFLYLANWGTHVFKLRLPVRLLDEGTARLYCAGEHAFLRKKNSKIISRSCPRMSRTTLGPRVAGSSRR